jgi:hypothetical protein
MFALLIGTQRGVFRLGNDGNLQQEEGSSTVTFEVLIDLRCRLSHLPPRSPVRRQITDVPTSTLDFTFLIRYIRCLTLIGHERRAGQTTQGSARARLLHHPRAASKCGRAVEE